MRVPRLRPAHPTDLGQLLSLWSDQARFGARDTPPGRRFLERMLHDFDWVRRSRVIDGEAGIEGGIVIAERLTGGLHVARLEAAARSAELEGELLRWGLDAARGMGADVLAVWRGRDHGFGLPELGFEMVRPFWRMDRPSLEDLPGARLPAGYDLQSGGSVAPEVWASTYNRAFAGHWRHSEKTADYWSRRDPESELEIIALDGSGAAAALVACSIERYEDRRAQPVGVVEVVGTVPEHRRRGLARAMTVEGLRRLGRSGARSASLYVDGRNPDRAFDLYRDLGFGVAFEFEVWEQPA